VIAVSPPFGQQVAKGSAVKITISKGNQSFVPDVRNKSEADAKAILAEAGFTNIKSIPNFLPGDGQIGKVTDQSPEGDPNTPKGTGSQITIYVGAQQTTPTTTPPTSPSASPSPSTS
jgi:serine/threonine-protein kinase